MNRKTKVCHICSYYENILFDNLVVSQMEFTAPKVFFYKKYGAGKIYNKDYIDEIECFNSLDRVFFFSKGRKAFKAYRRLYNDTRFDMLFAHSLFTNGYVAYLANKTFGTPYIVMVQNTDINTFYKIKPYLSGVAHRILTNASKVVFASKTYRDELLSKHIPIDEKTEFLKKSLVIPYGIDDLFFDKNGGLDHKDNNNKLKIICVGQICRNKNQLGLAKAVNSLVKHGARIELTFIGKASSERVLNKLYSYSFVKVLPYMDKTELKSLYREADIFCLLSYTETFGLVYAEALSQGLPIIYSKGQGFDNQFNEGYVGYRADPHSLKSISEKITMVEKEMGTLSMNARVASQRFKWERLSEIYKNLYIDVIGEVK